MKLRNREEYWIGRTARRQHRCQSERGGPCADVIEPKQRYVAMELPPNSDTGNEGWWRMKVCMPCANGYNSELASQLFADQDGRS